MTYRQLIVLAFSLLISGLAHAKLPEILIDLKTDPIRDSVYQALVGNFQRAGYSVIGFDELSATAKDELLRFLDGTLKIEEIATLRQSVAYLIAGSVTLETGKALLASKVNPQSVVFQLQVISLATGERIYVGRNSATISYFSEQVAAEKAIYIGAQQTFSKIHQAIDKNSVPQENYYYELPLHNTKDPQLLQAVYAKIQHLPALLDSELEIRRVRIVKLHSKLNPENFLAQLQAIESDLFSLTLGSIQGDKIEVNVQPKKLIKGF